MIYGDDNIHTAMEKIALVRKTLGKGLGLAHSSLRKIPGLQGTIKQVRAGYKNTSPRLSRTDERLPPELFKRLSRRRLDARQARRAAKNWVRGK